MARRGGGGSSHGGSGSINIDLNLDSVQTAAFAFYIIFAIVFLIFTSPIYRVIKQYAAAPKIPYGILLLTSLLLTLVCILGAAIPPLLISILDPTYGLLPLFAFSLYFSEILIFATLFLLLNSRAQKHLNLGFAIWQHAISPGILAIWLILLIAFCGLRGSLSSLYASDSYLTYRSNAIASINMRYALATFQLLTSLDLIISSTVLYRRLTTRGVKDVYVNTILFFLSPVLAIWAIFMLGLTIKAFWAPAGYGLDPGVALAFAIMFGVFHSYYLYMLVKLPARDSVVAELPAHQEAKLGAPAPGTPYQTPYQ